MKIGAGTSRDNDGRDTACFIEKAGSFNKGSDGFFLTAYHPLHQLVPDHEISGTGIFIDEEKGSAAFHSFDDIGCLGGAAAGIFCIKGFGVFAVRQIVDKHGNICFFDTSSVFRADFQRAVIRDHIFSAVSGDMIINPQL